MGKKSGMHFFPLSFYSDTVTFLNPECIVFILFPISLGGVQDWKARRANIKNIFPPSSYLLTFSEKKSNVCLVLRHQRGAVEGRGTKVSERELNLKSQLLSECKLEQSNVWDRENAAGQIKMTDLSPFSCRALGAFLSPTNFSAFLICSNSNFQSCWNTLLFSFHHF